MSSVVRENFSTIFKSSQTPLHDQSVSIPGTYDVLGRAWHLLKGDVDGFKDFLKMKDGNGQTALEKSKVTLNGYGYSFVAPILEAAQQDPKKFFFNLQVQSEAARQYQAAVKSGELGFRTPDSFIDSAYSTVLQQQSELKDRQ